MSGASPDNDINEATDRILEVVRSYGEADEKYLREKIADVLLDVAIRKHEADKDNLPIADERSFEVSGADTIIRLAAASRKARTALRGSKILLMIRSAAMVDRIDKAIAQIDDALGSMIRPVKDRD